MVRTQVQLTADQIRQLRQFSADTGRSVADLVREGVQMYLSARHRPGREQRVQRALDAAGRFSSGSSDGSARHDRHLIEAFRK